MPKHVEICGGLLLNMFLIDRSILYVFKLKCREVTQLNISRTFSTEDL